jgi:hypothetical protein
MPKVLWYDLQVTCYGHVGVCNFYVHVMSNILFMFTRLLGLPQKPPTAIYTASMTCDIVLQCEHVWKRFQTAANTFSTCVWKASVFPRYILQFLREESVTTNSEKCRLWLILLSGIEIYILYTYANWDVQHQNVSVSYSRLLRFRPTNK